MKTSFRDCQAPVQTLPASGIRDQAGNAFPEPRTLNPPLAQTRGFASASWFHCLAAVALAVCATGCQSMLEGTPFAPKPNTDEARLAYALQQAEREVTRLRARVDAFEQNNERLEGRIIDAERQTRDILRLRDELQQIRNDRAKLRDEISQSMGVTIKRMLDEQQAQTLAQVQKALASSRPAAPSKQTGYNHTVAAGQTLSLIAREYKTTIDAIMKANNLTNANDLRVGMVLFIPEK
ncbi:MAG: LysM peptidoglycan-binding domain-containing protein [Lentisphaerae bacterium]|nr:LysM peptidoglycan-binding domain-containing protein [Lentisphaerota bacterium]